MSQQPLTAVLAVAGTRMVPNPHRSLQLFTPAPPVTSSRAPVPAPDGSGRRYVPAHNVSNGTFGWYPWLDAYHKATGRKLTAASVREFLRTIDAEAEAEETEETEVTGGSGCFLV